MVTEDDVRYAYRLFLGREPENTDVIRNFARCPTLEALSLSFLRCTEFGNRWPEHALPTPGGLLGDASMEVESEVPPATLAEMLSRIGEVWTGLGETEPYWSVLSADHFRLSTFKENRDEFYASGERDFGVAKAFLARSGKRLPEHGRCFELGCGAGRVTLALARHFDEVVAYDISKTHLEIARSVVLEAGFDNVKFSLPAKTGSLRQFGSFDFVVSLIALQHNPPPVIAFLVREICGILAPGGIAYFQVPTYRAGYRFSAHPYLSEKGDGIEMHALPQPIIFKMFEQEKCRILEVREDGWVGSPYFISNTFLIEKRGD